MGSRQYKITALANARKQELTSSQVAALDYRGTAALAGVKVEANGNSPSDFFYVAVRRKVADTLWAEQLAAADAAMIEGIQSKLTTEEDKWFAEKIDAAALVAGVNP